MSSSRRPMKLRHILLIVLLSRVVREYRTGFLSNATSSRFLAATLILSNQQGSRLVAASRSFMRREVKTAALSTASICCSMATSCDCRARKSAGAEMFNVELCCSVRQR